MKHGKKVFVGLTGLATLFYLPSSETIFTAFLSALTVMVILTAAGMVGKSVLPV